MARAPSLCAAVLCCAQSALRCLPPLAVSANVIGVPCCITQSSATPSQPSRSAEQVLDPSCMTIMAAATSFEENAGDHPAWQVWDSPGLGEDDELTDAVAVPIGKDDGVEVW
ncbi:hypothetical protein LY78DRAFT_719303 [Colletotrichum sublineola]|nr:hypothetical protein LY78DRAFT_719303 [Colletotrichum sublineola]